MAKRSHASASNYCDAQALRALLGRVVLARPRVSRLRRVGVCERVGRVKQTPFYSFQNPNASMWPAFESVCRRTISASNPSLFNWTAVIPVSISVTGGTP